MVGDIGTAKSRLGAEASEIKPNSRHVSAPHATTKTITAIPEKINEITTLMLGAIPLSKNAICAIDEINSFPIEDQGRLLDILEDGEFNFDKMGIRQLIQAPTTIIATANAVGGNWNSPEFASKEEIQLKKNLLDRFPQVYAVRDDMDESLIDEFVKQMDKINQRKPHNYYFLRKYLIYASNIQDVRITKGARTLLNEFWKQAKLKGLLSIRMYKGLYKIAEAQTKLQLKTQVDEEIANSVMVVNSNQKQNKNMTIIAQLNIRVSQDILIMQV
jgi:DNA replicative helicase MCM subunit Mcm2 (Cdc46/Mcm family)